MFKIKIIDDEPKKMNLIDDTMVCKAKVYINSDEINVSICVDYWTLQMYIQQWINGINYLKTHNSSCLLTTVDKQEFDFEDGNSISTPIISMFALYKKDNKVVVQKLEFWGALYDKYIGKKQLPSVENFYEYIPVYNKYYSPYADNAEIFYTINAEKIDQELRISLLEDAYETIDDQTFRIGTITINGQSQKIYLFSEKELKFDFQEQWKEGIKRIKTQNNSCLITQISHCSNNRYLVWWLLYKDGDSIKIYFDSYDYLEYQEQFGDTNITSENCYDFIPSEKLILEKHSIKEWVIDLEEVIAFGNELEQQD